MNVLSLFAGIGGFDLGLQRAGFDISAQVEIDPFCTKILEKHWPGVDRYEDITKIEEFPKADIICGGFPCQDISVAGKGAGLSGDRSGLWTEALRAICMVRPKYAIMENVAALCNRGLSIILGSLAESGYDSEWDCLPARAFGAPHQRDRLFVVAYPMLHREPFDAVEGRHALVEAIEIKPEPSRSGELSGEITNTISHKLRQQQRRRGGSSGQGASEPGDNGPIGHNSNTSKLGLSRRTVLSATAFEARRFRPEGDNPWSTESRICGVAHGVPNRIHRIKALGNAVIPQIPEFIGNCILEAERA